MAEAARDLRFDLVVATVDRTEPLGALLDSLEAQTHRAFRLVVVDQNADDRVEALLAAHPELDVLHLRAIRGLSRARNVALSSLSADLVAFPDDDCAYAPDLLERVASRFTGDARLDGLTRAGSRERRLRGLLMGARSGRAHAAQPLESRDLVHRLPPP